MKVRAVRTGFFDHIRRRGDDVLGEGRGDVFSIPDAPRRKLSEKDAREAAFEPFKAKDGTVPSACGKWMVPVAAREVERVTTGPQALATVQADLKASKTPGGSTGDAEVI